MHQREVATLLTWWLITQDTDFCQQGIGNWFCIVVYKCLKCGTECTEKQRYSSSLQFEPFLLELKLYNPIYIYIYIYIYIRQYKCILWPNIVTASFQLRDQNTDFKSLLEIKWRKYLELRDTEQVEDGGNGMLNSWWCQCTGPVPWINREK